MGKQSRPKKKEKFGKGKVTPVQVAFIVDRYLSDNNYPDTRSAFRTEASSLISKSPAREAPRSLLSLGAMLDEYICLKEEKVFLEQEKVRLEQEKCRVNSLLQGMQNVMNVYNASTNMIPNAVPASNTAAALPPTSRIGSQSGHNVYATNAVVPVPGSGPGPSNLVQHPGNFFTPILTQTSARNKRVSAPAMEPLTVAKKARSKPTSSNIGSQGTDKVLENCNVMSSQLTAQPSLVTQSSSFGANGMDVQMSSSVAKCLFNENQQSPLLISSDPNTPPHSSQSGSPIGTEANCSNNNTQEITPSNCTIVSTERAVLTPSKQMTCYTIERSHCISSCSPAKSNLKRLGMRDHVKGRLDFGGADVTENLDQPTTDITTFECPNQTDYFDIDFPNLDAFGENFSFSELLLDLDLGCEGLAFPFQSTPGASGDTLSGSSSPESGDGNLGTNQVMSEFSSTVTEVLSEKDGTTQGPETVTSVKSITKCIRILSPVKGSKNSPGKQNCYASN